MNEQKLWLGDHPEKTVADFERVSTEASAVDLNQDLRTNLAIHPREAIEFLAWQELCRVIDEGYAIRLGGGNFQRTAKRMPPEYKRQRERKKA